LNINAVMFSWGGHFPVSTLHTEFTATSNRR